MSRGWERILGRVDELFEDNPHGNERYQNQKGLAPLRMPRGNASPLLAIGAAPFDLCTERVEVLSIVERYATMALGW